MASRLPRLLPVASVIASSPTCDQDKRNRSPPRASVLVVIHAQPSLPFFGLAGRCGCPGGSALLAYLQVAVEVLFHPAKGLQVETGLPRFRKGVVEEIGHLLHADVSQHLLGGFHVL